MVLTQYLECIDGSIAFQGDPIWHYWLILPIQRVKSIGFPLALNASTLGRDRNHAHHRSSSPKARKVLNPLENSIVSSGSILITQSPTYSSKAS